MRFVKGLSAVAALAAFVLAGAADAADFSGFPEDDIGNVMSPADIQLSDHLKKRFLGSKTKYRKEKASQQHDSVTIIIQEKTSTAMSSQADLKRNANNTAKLSSWLTFGRSDGNFSGTQRGEAAGQPTPTFSYSSSRGHKSDSTVNRSQTLTGTVTGKVIEVHPNGHLVVEASKTVTVNGETQKLTLTGTVNPDHLNSNNEIKADRIIDMAIRYEGTGPMSRMDKRPWGAQIVDFVTPF